MESVPSTIDCRLLFTLFLMICEDVCHGRRKDLISCDGHDFYIKRELAMCSGTIKAMLSGPGQFEESELNVVHFRDIPSHVLHKVCQYLSYKHRYTNSPTEIPEFPLPAEGSLELLMAANFLDC
ncbi:hypothetical protein QR680_006307 [Steinernema hermaphroditum]|uniref:Elongin-C n=1 Tax=Steinernema hermaphroditum TaxID=289476 RepID=A0AA39HW75_9BILA|nr:hypothetical protein QR680_006307 [Steinernema hermaphroditum]